MELPLDAQGSGSCLDVDKCIEQCRVVVCILHILAWFILGFHMQHLQGIHTYSEEAPRTELLGLLRWLGEGERGTTAGLMAVN
jgi:hypothetical protein